MTKDMSDTQPLFIVSSRIRCRYDNTMTIIVFYRMVAIICLYAAAIWFLHCLFLRLF